MLIQNFKSILNLFKEGLVESVFAHFQEKLDRSHDNKAKKNTQISWDSELFKTVIQIIENSKTIKPFIMPNEVSLKNFEINNRVINIFALKNGDSQRNTIINMLYKYVQLVSLNFLICKCKLSI